MKVVSKELSNIITRVTGRTRGVDVSGARGKFASRHRRFVAFYTGTILGSTACCTFIQSKLGISIDYSAYLVRPVAEVAETTTASDVRHILRNRSTPYEVCPIAAFPYSSKQSSASSIHVKPLQVDDIDMGGFIDVVEV